MGPHSCAVSGCKNNTQQKEVSFFSMPRNKERFKSWLNLIGRPDLMDKLNSRRRVCSKHFEEDMINNKRLKTNAIPQLYLPKINQKTKYSPKLLITRERGTQTIFCKSDMGTQADFTDDDDDYDDDNDDHDDSIPSYSKVKMECNGLITDIKIEKFDEPNYIECEIEAQAAFENLYDSEMTVKTERL